MPYSQLHFQPPVIAHRGARARAPENTMPAFVAAGEDGAVWIEADVKLTADGVPILMHDETLERTTNGHGAVADTTWAQIQMLDAGGWFAPEFVGTRIPTLAELMNFSRATGMRLNLELKPCPGRTQVTAMVALIEASKLWSETALPPLISSFDVEALKIASRLHPEWPRGLLLDAWREDWRDLVDETHASTLNINVDLLTPERIEILREAQMPFLAFTVNDVAQAKNLLQEGACAVYADDPAGILEGL